MRYAEWTDADWDRFIKHVRTRGIYADLNRLAAAIVEQATDETPQEPESQQTQAGRAGGHKGGKARAKRMSAKERSEAARKAAQARWGT